MLFYVDFSEWNENEQASRIEFGERKIDYEKKIEDRAMPKETLYYKRIGDREGRKDSSEDIWSPCVVD